MKTPILIVTHISYFENWNSIEYNKYETDRYKSNNNNTTLSSGRSLLSDLSDIDLFQGCLNCLICHLYFILHDLDLIALLLY